MLGRAVNSKEKQWAAISYLWIFSIIILLARQDNSFIAHHARRGTTLFILSILLWIFPALRYGEFIVFLLIIMGFIFASLGNENRLAVWSKISDTIPIGTR